MKPWPTIKVQFVIVENHIVTRWIMFTDRASTK